MVDAPRMTVPTQAVLGALLGAEDEVFGLEIVRTSGLGAGTIYPILQRLQAAGWVTARWEPADDAHDRGPPRAPLLPPHRHRPVPRRTRPEFRHPQRRTWPASSTTGRPLTPTRADGGNMNPAPHTLSRRPHATAPDRAPRTGRAPADANRQRSPHARTHGNPGTLRPRGPPRAATPLPPTSPVPALDPADSCGRSRSRPHRTRRPRRVRGSQHRAPPRPHRHPPPLPVPTPTAPRPPRHRPRPDGALDSAAVISRVTERVLAVQIAETRLVTALDKLETLTNRARAARNARALFYPHGGRLVISPPMHERLAQRQELADNTAEAIHIIARRALHSCSARPRPPNASPPPRTATSTTSSTKPPLPPRPPPGTHHHRSWRLLRAALPAGQRHEWWREICSLFAEATPTERRQARLSLLLNAHRILWTTWAISAHTRRHPTRPGTATPNRSASDSAPRSDTDHYSDP